MAADGFAYLLASNSRLMHIAGNRAHGKDSAVEQLHRAGAPVDTLHDAAVAVFGKAAALFVKVESLPGKTRCRPYAGGRLQIERQPCLRIAFANYYFFEAKETVCGRRAYLRDTFYLDFLDEFTVVSIYRVEPKHHIIYVARAMGCRV